MPTGGARARSGPPPDPGALRRDRKDDAEWTTLPAAGREGEPPEWPLADPSGRELALWEREWRRPQAVEWERSGQEIEVALYVRSLVDAERPGATAASRTLVRQQKDSLGLSQPGLRSNRWVIGEVEPEQKVEQQPGSSSKARLKVVDADSA